MNVTRQTITDYLVSQCGVDAADVNEDTLLFTTGVLDSFALVDLIVFLEGASGRRFKPTDVNLENLDSIKQMLSFLAL